MVPDIGIPPLGGNFAMAGFDVADHVPKAAQGRDAPWKSTCRSDDGDGLLFIHFRHFDIFLGF